MRASTIALAFGLACIATLPPLMRAQTAPSAAQVALDAHRSLGRPQTFRNLTLIPVYDTRATSGNDYITLDEGLKSGLVTVRESANGGEVNTLYLTNKANKPLYLMAGEVVLGGQQDRCIGNDALVKAGTKQLPITVFCVEHGRWTGQAHFAESARTVASADIRASAQMGAFSQQVAAVAAPAAAPTRNVAPVSRQGRLLTNQATNVMTNTQGLAGEGQLAQGRNITTVGGMAALGVAQQQVWDKVALKNRRFKTETESGTYRNTLNLSGGNAQQSVAPYIKALASAPGAAPHLVGMVAAINGKVVTADVFGNSTLFRKLWPKLLRSYAADAAENAHSSKSSPLVTEADARRFLQQTKDGANRVDARGVTGVNTRLDARQTVSYQLLEGGKAGAAGSPALHENVLHK
jgi:hypothetical protein